jgi:hypothetical protein
MKTLINIAIFSLFILAGCSTMSVQTDYETTYDFSTLKTYAWLDSKEPSKDIRINNSLIINRVVNAVDSSLQSRGYTLVDKDEADFYVNWFGGLENKMRVETINTYYGDMGYGYRDWGYRSRWPGSRTYTYEYQQGTLIIDIADSKSKQLIWRGTGKEYFEEKETPEQITADIKQAVDTILNQFPPETVKAPAAQ